MATPEEIESRVEQADSARSARRAAAATQVGELAQRRSAIAEQLSELEAELGDVLVAADDVIGVDELARFTDVPAADLTRWLDARKASRPKRKRAVLGPKSTTYSGPSVTKTPSARQMPSQSEPAPTDVGTADTPAHLSAKAI
jgi:hypothetical protein